jgi:hypothetical protein
LRQRVRIRPTTALAAISGGLLTFRAAAMGMVANSFMATCDPLGPAFHDFFPQDFMHIWYSVLHVGPG